MNLYERSLQLWGEQLQLDTMIEECAELIQAITKLKRRGLHDLSARYGVIEEIADVRLMLNQMNYLFAKPAIRSVVHLKMRRLQFRIEQEEKRNAEEIKAIKKRDVRRADEGTPD